LTEKVCFEVNVYDIGILLENSQTAETQINWEKIFIAPHLMCAMTRDWSNSKYDIHLCADSNCKEKSNDKRILLNSVHNFHIWLGQSNGGFVDDFKKLIWGLTLVIGDDYEELLVDEDDGILVDYFNVTEFKPRTSISTWVPNDCPYDIGASVNFRIYFDATFFPVHSPHQISFRFDSNSRRRFLQFEETPTRNRYDVCYENCTFRPVPENHKICDQETPLPECDDSILPWEFCVTKRPLNQKRSRDSYQIYREHDDHIPEHIPHSNTVFQSIWNCGGPNTVFQYVCSTHPENRTLILLPCTCYYEGICVPEGSEMGISCPQGIVNKRCLSHGWENPHWDCDSLALEDAEDSGGSSIWIFCSIILVAIILIIAACLHKLRMNSKMEEEKTCVNQEMNTSGSNESHSDQQVHMKRKPSGSVDPLYELSGSVDPIYEDAMRGEGQTYTGFGGSGDSGLKVIPGINDLHADELCDVKRFEKYDLIE